MSHVGRERLDGSLCVCTPARPREETQQPTGCPNRDVTNTRGSITGGYILNILPDAKVTVSLLYKQISGPIVRANNEAVSGSQRTVSTARASVQTAPVKRAHNGHCLMGRNTWRGVAWRGAARRGATTARVDAILQPNPLPSCVRMLQRAASI